jgi:hypothetical protein
VPLTKIENDSQIRLIEEKLVDALLATGMITKDQAEQYITTIRITLPQLQLMELEDRESSVLKKTMPINACFLQPPSKGLFFAGLIEKLFNAFIPATQAGYCGYCYYMPECFQVGIPGPVGYNIWKAFCRCTGCYSGQGCLESCGETQSAIWDPMSGICGCG